MTTLPNPFLDANQHLFQDWPTQRAYLAGILAEDLYGQMPPPPGNVRAELRSTRSLWDGAGLFEVYDRLRLTPQRHGIVRRGRQTVVYS